MAKTKSKARSTTTATTRKAGKTAIKKAATKKSVATAKKPAARTAAAHGKARPAQGETKVTLDRRASRDRRSTDRRQGSQPVAVERRKIERRAKVNRRRQIDPTTCERDYTNEEIEFMNALDAYKRSSGRMFPTCSEVLEVIRKLGYERLSDAPGPSSTTTDVHPTPAPRHV